MKTNKHISVIIKVTNACNLNCKYCYDANCHKKTFIPLEYVEKLFALIAKTHDSVKIIWHGGEPMLIGMKFYENIVRIQKDFPMVKFDNHIQTNGTLIDDEWAAFFVQNGFNVGVSYDGGDERTGRERQQDSLNGRNLIVQHGGSCGVLTVIDRYNVENLLSLYQCYNRSNISVQFNCVFPSGRTIENGELLISTNEYVSNMCALFDYWLFDSSCKISVEPFIGYIRALCGYNTKCITQGCLYKWLCLDSTGAIFPCGRMVDKTHELNHITSISSIDDIFNSTAYNELTQAAILRRDLCLQNCDLFRYCRGGCNADAFMYGDISQNNHIACLSYKAIMKHIIMQLATINSDSQNINPYVRKYICKIKK